MKVMIALFTLIAVIGCSKEKFKTGQKRLPNATEKGRGIWGCYIDDNTFIGRKQEKAIYRPDDGYLFMNSINERFEFRLFVYEGLHGKGDYKFSNTGEEWLRDGYTDFYGLDSTGHNNLQITKLDLDKKIIAGRFDMDLFNENGEIKKIRSGRFDLEMEILP